MSSPAERYAAAKARAAQARTALHEFRSLYSFELDTFQVTGCEALEAGRGVLVAAPTGAGKTVVGEFAVHLALRSGRKCFYTTPIKALSNQKFHDLVDRYGADKVGLLTGDNSINGEAPIVIMTTEVLRNMIYARSSTLDSLGYVVMDEVHYLADRFRGPVWEEVIIHLPESVAVVALSATVSNAEEFGEWLTTVRGDTTVVVEEHRPVPLWQQVMVGRRLHDLFVDDSQRRVNPDLDRIHRDEGRAERTKGHRPGRGGHRPRSNNTPLRAEVIDKLRREELLPVITFIFSRAGCDSAVSQCLAAGVRLTDPTEREEIRRIVETRCADIPQEDLQVLGYLSWLDGLERGLAAHHAGLLPTFKEVVEELFQKGLVKAVFATETLALGINMPARTVVLERLVKWNGEAHVAITPGEYTQLTGRAGRRGLDTEGDAVVIWHQGLDPASLAGLASARTYPLRSSFRPTYNMSVNLVSRVGYAASRELLESSFAQFQADQGVVGLARQIRKQEDALEGYADAMACHLGDFAEYAALRRKITDLEKGQAREGAATRRAAANDSLAKLRTGDVVLIPSGRRTGPAVVLDPGISEHDDPRPVVMTLDKQVRRLSSGDFVGEVAAVERVRLPAKFSARSANSRRELADLLRAKLDGIAFDRPTKLRHAIPGVDEEIAALRRAQRAHPCHGCDEREDHARWATRWATLRRETDDLRRRVDSRTNSIAATFDRICDLLTELGYLRGKGVNAQVTPAGEQLGALYTESDLLAAECLRQGVWHGLNGPELAATVAALVFESRGDDETNVEPRVPAGAREALSRVNSVFTDLAGLERDYRLPVQRRPDLGFSWAAYRWASGTRLEAVLREADLTPGDFVRWCKQLIDLLGQIADVADDGSPEGAALAAAARAAVTGVRRGVVSYSSVV